MPLRPQNYPVPFGGGINTKVAGAELRPPELTGLENAVFTKAKEYRKRFGFLAKPYPWTAQYGIHDGAAYLAAPQGSVGSLTAFDEELIVAGAGAIASYLKTADKWQVKEAGAQKLAFRSVQAKTGVIVANQNEQTEVSSASRDGLTLYAYRARTPGGVATLHATVIDETSGVKVLNDVSLGVGFHPQCVAAKGFLYLFSDDGTGEIDARRVAISNPAAGFSNPVACTIDLSADAPGWAVRAVSDTAFVFAFVSAEDAPAPNQEIVVQYFDVVTNQPAGDAQGYPDRIKESVGGDFDGEDLTCFNLLIGPAGTFWLFYGDTDLMVIAWDSTLARIRDRVIAIDSVTDFMLAEVTGIADGDAFRVFCEFRSVTVRQNSRIMTVLITPDNAAVPAVADVCVRSLGLASDAFLIDGVPHVCGVYDSDIQPTLFLLSCKGGKGVAVAALLNGEASGLIGEMAQALQSALFRLPTVHETAAKKFVFGVGSKGPLTSEAGNVVFSVDRISRVFLDFTQGAERYRNTRLGQNLHWAGGLIGNYDGAQLSEHGFLLTPERVTVEQNDFQIKVTDYGKAGTVPWKFDLIPPSDDSSSAPARVSGARIRHGAYFLLFGSEESTDAATTKILLRFNVDNGGGLTTFVGVGDNRRTTISGIGPYATAEVKISSGDSAAIVGFKICQEINRLAVTPVVNGGCPAFKATVDANDPTGTVHFVEAGQHGAPWSPPCGDTQFGYNVIRFGSTGATAPTHQEVNRLIFPAGKWIQPGQYFLLESPKAGQPHDIYLLYFTVDGGGSAPVIVPSGVTHTNAIAILSTDTAQSVAHKVFLALNALAGTPFGTSAVDPTGGGNTSPELLVYEQLDGASYDPIMLSFGSSNRAGTVGGEITSGARLYYAIYEWTDAAGEYHRSAPSVPFRAEFGAQDSAPSDPYDIGLQQRSGNTARISVGTLRVTAKGQVAVRIGVFRTEANGQIPYRIATLQNDTTVDSVSLIDTLKDSDLLNAETLYTAGGELENDCPPAASVVVTHQNRVFLAGIASDPYEVRYSKEFEPGFGVAFSDLLSMRVDAAGGPITALGSLDDKLVIFKESRIFMVTGNGPDKAGQANTFSQPALINTDVGCVSPESVVFVPDGLMFQSAKGIYLLTRGYEAVYIGAPVEAFNDQDVTSAVLLPDVSQVRFTTSNGWALVFDYQQKVWSTFTNYNGVSACVWNGLYVRLGADGTVYEETPNLFSDCGSKIRMLLATAWLRLGEQEGFGRLWRAILRGVYKSGGKLRAEAYFDFDETPRDILGWNLTALFGGDTFGSDGAFGLDVSAQGVKFGGSVISQALEIDAGFKIQQCKAVKLVVYDLPDGAGETCSLSGLDLEIGVTSDAKKLAKGRRGT